MIIWLFIHLHGCAFSRWCVRKMLHLMFCFWFLLGLFVYGKTRRRMGHFMMMILIWVLFAEVMDRTSGCVEISILLWWCLAFTVNRSDCRQRNYLQFQCKYKCFHYSNISFFISHVNSLSASRMRRNYYTWFDLNSRVNRVPSIPRTRNLLHKAAELIKELSWKFQICFPVQLNSWKLYEEAILTSN